MTVHLGTTRVNNQLDALFNVFISLLYMFRATQCSSSGESIVSVYHLVYITLCRWLSGIQIREELSDRHTRRPPTQSDIYQTMYWYNWFSLWWGLLYMFRVTRCLSSGESIVSIHHLVYITLCRWPSGMQLREELSDRHTRQSPTQSDIYQMMYWYNWFSWWWALGCSKHVEKGNKYNEKCASSWLLTRITSTCVVNEI